MGNVNWSADRLVDFLKTNCNKKDLTDSDGEQIETINSDVILQFLNTGRRLIQNAVANVYQHTFAEYEYEEITEALLAFPIPETAIYQRRILRLDYARTNTEVDFRPIKKARTTKPIYTEGWPLEYFIQGVNVVVTPAPTTGYYRFLIQRRDDSLDVRRGSIVTVTPSSGTVLTIELDTASSLFNAANKVALETAEWICICDYEGEVKSYNLPVESFSESTGVISIRSGYTIAASGWAAGDYITIGKYSSTHSKLPDGFQDYFLTFAKYAIENDESNTDKIEQIPILQTIKATILDGFSDDADDQPIQQIGNLDGNWFDEDV